jgi:IS5 family transposase
MVFRHEGPCGVDLTAGLMLPVIGTADSVADLTLAHALLHAGEKVVLGDAATGA